MTYDTPMQLHDMPVLIAMEPIHVLSPIISLSFDLCLSPAAACQHALVWRAGSQDLCDDDGQVSVQELLYALPDRVNGQHTLVGIAHRQLIAAILVPPMPCTCCRQ